MARSFASTSSQYLEIDQPAAGAVPLTLAAWFNAATLVSGNDQYLITLHDKDVADQGFRMAVYSTSGVVWAYTYAGSSAYATSSTGTSTGVWTHAAAVFYASNSRAAFINGSNKGTNSTDLTPAGIDRVSIGRAGDSTPGHYFNGGIADVAAWTAALTDAEVAVLGLGVSPLLVRPADLVAYWPLFRDEDRDRVGNYNMTAYNSPTITAHPPIVKPWWMQPTLVRIAAPALAGILGERGTLRGVLRGAYRGL